MLPVNTNLLPTVSTILDDERNTRLDRSPQTNQLKHRSMLSLPATLFQSISRQKQ